MGNLNAGINKEAIFNLIGNLVDLGIWQYNVTRDYLEWDAVMFKIYGQDEASFEHKFSDWRKAVHPDDIEGAEASFQESVQSEGEFVYTFRIVHPDGEIRYIKANAQSHGLNEAGEHIIVGANQDVTEFLKVSEENEALIETLKDSQDTARIGSWQYYPETNVSVLDEVTKRIYGLPPEYKIEAAEGITYYKKGYSRDKIMEAFGELLEKKKPYDLELQLITAQGKEIWVRTIGKPKLNAAGKVIKASGVFQDITEQKERELALLESTRRFEGAFEHSAIGMALVGLDGKWLKVNKRLVDYFGYEESELLKKTFQDLTHPKDLNTDLEFLKDCINGKIDHYHMDKRYRRKSGEWMWAMLSVAVVRDAQNKPLYFISQIEDINARKTYEEQLLEANQSLIKLTNKLSLQNRSLNDFAHITSHNLRAPVANLILLTDLYESADDAEYKDVIFTKMAQSTADLNETLDELVEALIIKNKAGMEMQELDLRDYVNTVLKKQSALIRHTDAKIEMDLGFEKIFAQPHYLESILLNLISNAIKYKSPDRRPEIQIKAYQKEGVPTLEIRDNGVGIDLVRHGHKVFGLHKTFHKNSDARGVGLFMVKVQMEAMGGEVTIESEPGEGSVFKLQFKPELQRL